VKVDVAEKKDDKKDDKKKDDKKDKKKDDKRSCKCRFLSLRKTLLTFGLGSSRPSTNLA
jgi:hypothetical protein